MARSVICITLLLGAFSLALAAMGSPMGFYGYGYVPTARTLPHGSLGYTFSIESTAEIPEPENDVYWQQHHTLLGQPLSWMEVGASAHRTVYSVDSLPVDWHGNLAGKITFPKASPYLPALAVGSYDVIQDGRFLEHIYFVGGFDWRAFDGGLSLDMGAIYHRLRNPYDPSSGNGTTSFLAMEFDLIKISFVLQGLWQGTRFGVAPGVSFKPFAREAGPSWLQVSAGAEWRTPTAKTSMPAWFSAQILLPAQEVSTSVDSSKTWFWIDFNPVLDHSFGSHHEAVRGALEIEGVAATSLPGLYFVNAIDFSKSFMETERLVRRDRWDRSYVLLRRDSSYVQTGALRLWLPVLYGGLLNSGILGVQGQAPFGLLGFAPAKLEGGYTWGDQEGWNATLEMPLHPRFSGALRYTQLSVEGGWYLGNHLGFMGSLTQGSPQNHLKIGVGYDQDAKSILVESTLTLNLFSGKSLSTHGITARLAPHAEHRLTVPAYIYEYQPPVYIDGNNSRKLHGVPWTP